LPDQPILSLRGERVILDSDLARLYGVPTKRLNEQVRRNRLRFPPEFVFRLNRREKARVVAECDHLARIRFSPALPHAFTEHGAIMAANVFDALRALMDPPTPERGMRRPIGFRRLGAAGDD
jgi:hypothetical protein